MAETSMRTELTEPFLELGIQDTNFFNGRLLTAGDLVRVQDASRRRDRQLGLAVGSGIVCGLEVRLLVDGSAGQPPVLGVSQGLAFNAKGQAVALPQKVEVLLDKETPTKAPAKGAKSFDVCQPIQQNGKPLPGKGAYVFVARPATGHRGNAPRRGFGQTAKVEGCDRDLLVEGVQFRLVPMGVGALDNLSLATRESLADLLQKADAATPAGLAASSKLRNWLAHACFGTEELASWSLDPFERVADDFFGSAIASPYRTYGAVDKMHRLGLLDGCDVPLALVCWTKTGVKWVDMWSVRRRPVQLPVGKPWSLLVDQRRLAESEAMILQFQRQLEEMADRPDPAAEPSLKNVTASSRFQYLPPAGYLPVDSTQFSADEFFRGLVATSEQVDLAFARLLIQRSWFADPIDLADPAPVRILSHGDAPGYVIFLRDQARPAAEPEPPLPPGPEPGARTGQIIVDVAVQKLGERSRNPFLREAKRRKGASPRTVKVEAVDRDGQPYPGTFIRTSSQIDDLRPGTITFDQGVARFAIGVLPPEIYTVFVRASGYKTASKVVEVTAGKKSFVEFALVAEDKTEDRQPHEEPGRGGTKRGAVADWIRPEWYALLYALEEYARWPWPPDPEILPEFDPVVDPPPPDVDYWIEQLIDQLRTQYPDAPIDPGDTQLLIDKGYTPDGVSSDPYAYLVFGDSGVYLPVVLVSRDMALERPVSTGKAGLPAVDSDMAAHFAAAGVSSVDILTGAWTGLVEDVLSVGPEAARGLVETARGQVATLQGGLQVFSGVDAALETGLKDVAGIDSAEALANADPQALVDAVGADTLSITMARVLVDQARSVVPRANWSLSESSLGLSEREVVDLAGLGITSLGALKDLAGTDEGKARIGAALGTPADQVEGLVSGIVIRDSASIRADRQAAAPVTNVVGVDLTTGLRLASLGFGSLGSLAAADPGALAGAFGGDQARAAAAIDAARLRLGL